MSIQDRFEYKKSHFFFDWLGSHYSIPKSAYPEMKYVRMPSGAYLKITWTEYGPRFDVIKFMVAPTEYVVDAKIDYTDHLG